jgi:hypothetical protein
MFFIVSISPFVYAFYPKSLEVGTRSYSSALSLAPTISGILQVGQDNFVWGRVYNSFLSFINPSYKIGGEYYNCGFNVPIFILFCFSIVYFFRCRNLNTKSKILCLCGISVVVSWVMTFNFFGYSGWYLIFHYFPGAKALNVINTYQMFLVFPVTVLAVIYLSKLKLPGSIIFLVAFILIISDINKPYLNLYRMNELERINVQNIKIPKSCKVFYVSGWNKIDHGLSPAIDSVYAHNVSAIMLAQIFHIPTINGFASFNPRGWDFANPHNKDYERRVLNYVNLHKLSNVCRYDLNSKIWSPLKGKLTTG